MYSHKEVKVRTPRRGRSKSIVVPGTNSIPRSFPIGRLNNYNKTMKRHKGPLSLMSELESIKEDSSSEKQSSNQKGRNSSVNEDINKNYFFDIDDQKSAAILQQREESKAAEAAN